MTLFLMLLDSILEDFLEILASEPILPSPTRTPKKNLPLGKSPLR
jgi:hypothetical protein